MPTFEPPFYHVEVPRHLTGGPRYRFHESQSVVRVSGTLTTVKSPTHEQLVAAGDEGVDWFLGGRIYNVSVTTADELTLAGYTVEG